MRPLAISAGSASTVPAPALSPWLYALFAAEPRHSVHTFSICHPTGQLAAERRHAHGRLLEHTQSNEPRWVGPGDVFLPSLGVPWRPGKAKIGG